MSKSKKVSMVEEEGGSLAHVYSLYTEDEKSTWALASTGREFRELDSSTIAGERTWLRR